MNPIDPETVLNKVFLKRTLLVKEYWEVFPILKKIRLLLESPVTPNFPEKLIKQPIKLNIRNNGNILV